MRFTEQEKQARKANEPAASEYEAHYRRIYASQEPRQFILIAHYAAGDQYRFFDARTAAMAAARGHYQDCSVLPLWVHAILKLAWDYPQAETLRKLVWTHEPPRRTGW